MRELIAVSMFTNCNNMQKSIPFIGFGASKSGTIWLQNHKRTS